MARRPFFPPKRRPAPPRKKKTHILERTSAEEIRRIKLFGRGYLRLHWDYYSELAYQRANVAERITAALQEAAEDDYEFHQWQRVVRLKYALRPLSVAGSLKDTGGRFNIGDIDLSRYQAFPALYIARDKATALGEAFGKESSSGDSRALELALARPESIVAVSLSGKLDSVIDLNKPDRLRPFVDIIRNFETPNHLRRRAQALRVTLPPTVTSVGELIKALLSANWRVDAMALDIPAPSQIFGQMAANAGITGILFPSKHSGKECLAIYRHNFPGTASWMQLDDESPAELRFKKIDAVVWQESAQELCA